MDHQRENASPLLTSRERLLLCLAAGDLLAAGCLPAPGAGNAFYVVLPYAASVVLAASAMLMSFGLDFRRRAPERPLQERQKSLGSRAFAAAIASGVTAAGELLHLLVAMTSAADLDGGPLAGLAFVALAAGAGGCLILVQQSLRIRN